MSAPTALPPAIDGWEEQGRKVAHALDDVAAAIVIGDDPEAAARVAIGIARIQGLHRRVAVCDLVGDVGPLRPNADDDPHGIADCFLYGVSINRIARPLAGAADVFILPSGTEPVAIQDIVLSRRWHRLTAGFREVDALLLLVAAPRTGGLEALAAITEGAVVVGTPELRSVPVLARVHSPSRPIRPELVPHMFDGEAAAPAGAPGQGAGRWRIVLAASVLALGAIGLGAAGYTLWTDYSMEPLPPAVAVADSARGAVDANGVPTEPPVAAANPADSSAAAAFAVQLVLANTETGALARMLEAGAELPVSVVVPVTLADGSRWYRVLSGAYSEESDAESLLVALRERRVLAADAGGVVWAPFALLALSHTDSAGARAEIARLRQRGLPAYGLAQAAGSVHVYVGAFETTESALAAEPAVREAGFVPTVVYRIGRVF
ncbi:MAG TPA: SPOR domain-containing protein [Gemmatimonadaceae bacterium]|nr:SPOR domain-containing protein [Gemmatimonadaceae bacterium]